MKRLEVLKTYKLFINGEFPRTESGRYLQLKNKSGKLIANISSASRKDFRNSVVAARNAFDNWSNRTPFNRGQIIYRIAEMLEGRKSQFVEEIMSLGISKHTALKEIDNAIDFTIYIAGWCDKYQQIISSVNPVSTSHFNFSFAEPMGVVGIISDNNSPFGFLRLMLSVIAGGNCAIVVANEKYPNVAISFSEVLQTSDLPKGVVNILTAKKNELPQHIATHLDVNAIVIATNNDKELSEIKRSSSVNVKRVISVSETELNILSPDLILSTQEIKTTWHPIGI
ncbi:MAG: aldehyde dehydrogenase family protein [Bacteroidota bacterium]